MRSENPIGEFLILSSITFLVLIIISSLTASSLSYNIAGEAFASMKSFNPSIEINYQKQSNSDTNHQTDQKSSQPQELIVNGNDPRRQGDTGFGIDPCESGGNIYLNCAGFAEDTDNACMDNANENLNDCMDKYGGTDIVVNGAVQSGTSYCLELSTKASEECEESACEVFDECMSTYCPNSKELCPVI